MGNKLAALPPSHLTSSEQLLQDISFLKLEKELGSSPLFKVARARHEEWNKTVVVKAFLIPSIALPIDDYKNVIDQYRNSFDRKNNVLCYENVLITDKAVLLLRDYVDCSLQERMNTLPYLTMEEKKWIAFQLLCGLCQLHNLVDEEGGGGGGGALCHGDVKLENVFLTDWGWLYLADMAPFKPAYLPVDNPTEYGFFFDIARRQACYLAPERFIEGNNSKESEEDSEDLSFQENNFAAPGMEIPQPRTRMYRSKSVVRQPLEPAMDMFACGCVLLELFTDTRRAFSLSELLNYRSGTSFASPEQLPLVQQIPDKHVQELVCQLLERMPEKRKSADECLMLHRGKTFPEFFYRFLKSDINWFLDCDADARIFRIRKNLDQILDQQLGDRSQPSQLNSSLLIQINIVTASIPHLRTELAKMECLTLLQEFGKYLISDLVLNRIVPYMVELLQGNNSSEVRRHAIECISQCIKRIQSVSPQECDFFPEYLFPVIHKEVALENKSTQLEIKLAIAHALPDLADTALRFLNSAHENRQQSKDTEEMAISSIGYDKRLSVVRNSVRDIVVNLMSDGHNAIREVVAQPRAMIKLHDFFGTLDFNDAALSHVVTFLNDKDPHIRLSFLRMLPPVAMLCGAQWTHILHSLLELETHDASELVLEQCMRCLARLIRLGLLDRVIQRQLVLYGALPLLVHPSISIRSSALHMLVQFAHCACPAEVFCVLMSHNRPDLLSSINSAKTSMANYLPKPPLSLYFTHDVRCLSDEYNMWIHLRPPLPTAVFQMILNCGVDLSRLFSFLNDRRQVREMTRTGSRPSYSCTDDAVAQALISLHSIGLNEEMETQLCYLQPLLKQLYETRVSSPFSAEELLASAVSESPNSHPSNKQTKITINRQTLPPIEKVNVQLHPSLLPKSFLDEDFYHSSQNGDFNTTLNGNVANQEWRQMFLANPRSRASPNPLSSTAAALHHSNSVSTAMSVETAASLINTPGQKAVASIIPPSEQSSRLSEHLALYEIMSRHMQQAISQGYYCPRSLQQHISDTMQFSQVETSRSGAIGQSSYYYYSPPDASGESSNGIPIFDPTQPQMMMLVPQQTPIQTRGPQSANTVTHSQHPPVNTPQHNMWKPSGVLVAHLHEHKVGPVFLNSSVKGDVLVSAGMLGEVKLWKTNESYTQLPTRAAFTYRAPRESATVAGQCRDLVWLMGNTAVATCVDRSAIHIIDCSKQSQGQGLCILPIPEREGRCICLTSPQPQLIQQPTDPFAFFTSAPVPLAGDNLIMYATTNHMLIGHDLRTSYQRPHAWQAKLDSDYGLPTCMVMQPEGTWVTLGTMAGHLVTWDLRFQLPICFARHPSGLSVSTLRAHPATLRGEASWIFAAHQYNNEVALWDVESNQRPGVLWASMVPALSRAKYGAHTVQSLLIGGPGPNQVNRAGQLDVGGMGLNQCLSEGCYAVTGGTDCRLRYWHLGDASKSAMLSLAAGREESLQQHHHVSYNSQVVEGTLVYAEDMKRPNVEEMNSLLEESMRTIRDASYGHSNTITGLSLLCVDGQNVLVSGSADGVIKIWK